MQNAIQDYYNVVTANALDLTVKQVETVNELQRRHNDQLACEDAEAIGGCANLHEWQRAFDIKINGARVFVSWREDDWCHDAEVLADGTLKTES